MQASRYHLMQSARNCVYEYIQRKATVDVSYKSTSKSSSAEKTLIITILGYGLGLSTEGSSSLWSQLTWKNIKT